MKIMRVRQQDGSLVDIPIGRGKDGYTPIKGVDYFDGEDGYTPIKGVDYYTEADKSEFSEYIASELAKRGQVKPEFAQSEEWLDANGDQSKMYVLPDGMIWAYMLTEKEVESGASYTNLLPTATDTDGSIYNGVGYKNGARWSDSSGGETTGASAQGLTGFIPCKIGDIVRVQGFGTRQGKSWYVISFDSTGNALKSFTPYNNHIIEGELDSDSSMGSGYFAMEITTDNHGANVASVRFSLGAFSEESIITVNEEIKEGGTTTITEYAWVSTGHAFVSFDAENPIIQDIIREEISNIQLKPEFADDISKCTDTSKMYVLPDGFIYAYMLTEVAVKPSYTNVLPLAINADGTPYVGTNGEKGYKTGYRLNSSRAEVAATDRCCTGFIPVKYGDTVRFKNIYNPTDGGLNGYVHFYGSDFSTNTGKLFEGQYTNGEFTFVPSNVTSIHTANINATSATAYMRISTGIITANSIITINEEITESGGTTTDYAWASTGHAFVPADYEDRIVELEDQVKRNTADINTLKKGNVDTGGADALTWIRNWDAPIYDVNIPVFQLSKEKASMTNATKTPTALYAMYDALMAKYPHYITKTDLGICSDGVHHVYRYDFKEPEHRHTNNRNSETKSKAIIVSGIHLEWAGIFGLYYALEEIAENPALRNLRRNVHLIVIPCCNPFVTLVEHWDTHGGQQNANGVEIHRNFEAAFLYPDDSGYVPFGELHHGGTAPLSEVETQYIDKVLKENTDAALFLTCHNYNLDLEFGISFIWPSVATAYMCNMGYRLIDKLSDAWMDKYGDELAPGIESYRFDTVESWDTRLGHAQISASPGTETRQATKYGIQGANVEICERFHVHGTKDNPEPIMSSFTMSRGAEVYVNFLLTALGVYDPKDKKEYAQS